MMNRKKELTRESDLEYYQRKYFNELKDDYYKLEISDSTFRCPFCFNKDYYSLKDLLRHSSRIAADVHGETVKEIAKHSALARYLDLKISNDKSHDRNVDTEKSLHVNVADDKAESVNANAVKDRSLDVVTAKNKAPIDIANAAEDEWFVWPWMAVLANIVTEYNPKSGKYIGKSKKKITDELIAKGLQPLKVTPLWNHNGQTRFAIVEFGKEWDGFNNALKLESSFEAEHCGRRDYMNLKERGDKLFGWMARADDYNFRDIVGKHLRENGDLKTVSGKEAEDNRKALLLVSSLTNTLEQKKKELEQATRKYDEANVLLNKERSKVQIAELEAPRKEFMSGEEILQKREANIHIEKKQPFAEASKRKFPAEGNGKAAKIKLDNETKMKANQWDEYVTDKEGNSKEILDENDEKQKSWSQWKLSKQRKGC